MDSRETIINARLEALANKLKEPQLEDFAEWLAEVDTPFTRINNALETLSLALSSPENFEQKFGDIAAAAAVTIERIAVTCERTDATLLSRWGTVRKALDRLSGYVVGSTAKHLAENNLYVATDPATEVKNMLRMVSSKASGIDRIWGALRAVASLHAAVCADVQHENLWGEDV